MEFSGKPGIPKSRRVDCGVVMNNRTLRYGVVLAGILTAALVIKAAPRAADPVSCEKLALLALPNTRIDSAQIVAAGAFVQPGGRGANVFGKLPAFCRVAATLTPTSDSDIKTEVWLP